MGQGTSKLSPEEEQAIAAKVRKRKEIINEVVQTEETYVSILGMLVHCFLAPLEEAVEKGKPILKSEDIGKIFSIIKPIYQIHLTFLQELKDIVKFYDDNAPFAQIFVNNAELFKTYTEYVNNYNNSLLTLSKCHSNKNFQNFLQTNYAKPECRGRGDLSSLLITPIQRLPRYVLLLQELAKTTPKSHKDSPHVARALEALRRTTEHINNEKRHAENAQKLLALQSMFVDRIMLINTRRELIYEGEFTYRRKTRKNYKVMHFFLFDDMLLLGRMKTGLDRFKGLKQATYVVAAHAYLPKVEIWDLENTPEESFTIGVQIGVKDYVVKFSSQADKEACMTTFFATRSKAHRINYVDPLPAKNKGRKGEEEEEEEESVPKAKTAPSPRKGKETATQKGKEKEKEKEKEEKQKAKEEKQREKAEKQKMKEEKKKQAQDQKAKEKEKKKEKEKQEKRQSTLPLARGRTLTTSLSAMTTNITEGSKQAGQRLSAMSTNITEGSKHAGQKLRSSVRN